MSIDVKMTIRQGGDVGREGSLATPGGFGGVELQLPPLEKKLSKSIEDALREVNRQIAKRVRQTAPADPRHDKGARKGEKPLRLSVTRKTKKHRRTGNWSSYIIVPFYGMWSELGTGPRVVRKTGASAGKVPKEGKPKAFIRPAVLAIKNQIPQKIMASLRKRGLR